MKKLPLYIFLLITSISQAQSLPIDFETTVTTADFTDFDGGTASVISNPQVSSNNNSSQVAQIVRNGGQLWAGSKITLSNNLDFNALSAISMKIFTTAPIGITVKLKLEGMGETERDVQTTVNNEWEVLTWDFTGEPANFTDLVFMFDFGNIGDGTINSTFLFDDIEQFSPGTQIDWPVSFESPGVNYTMSDFGGNASSLVLDPFDNNNKVIKAIKTDQAATWAGTTIGTPAGFATNLPLSLNDAKMSVRVWSPEAGTPIRLKVEDWSDPTHTCETETNTTLAGEWETLVFDFTNQAPGTELLSVGLSMGWTYNMASIFFNFGTEGALAGAQTYYFDDVIFGDIVLDIENQKEVDVLQIFPNPASDQWTFSNSGGPIELIEIFDQAGTLIQTVRPNSSNSHIDISSYASGIFMVHIITDSKAVSRKLIKH